MNPAVTLVGAGQAVMWSAGVITALGVIVKTRPAKWLWRRNVSEPFWASFDTRVGRIVDDKLNARPLTNGWGTEAVKKIAEATGADVPPPGHPESDEDAA